MRLLAVLLLHVSPTGGDLLWPLGSGVDPYPLRATYAQIEGEDGNVDLHYGLDVAATAASEPVYALEDGIVAKVYTDKGYRSGVLIATDAGPALLYLHLEGASIQVAKGDHVETDDYLGEVVYADDATGVRHVHLSRLAETNHQWTGIDRFSSGNPLVELDPELLGDDSAPVIEAFPGGERFAVRRDEDPTTTATPEYLDLDALPQGRLDVLVRLADRDGSGKADLAPYWIQLEIVPASGSALVFETTLDGPLKPYEDEERALYNLDDEYPSGESGAYFVLTNGGPKPSISGAWSSKPGKYVLRVTVRDVAGNEKKHERKVTVE